MTSPSTGFTHLQHLNESDAQVQVGHVSTDQTQTEKDANGDNGAEVHPASHLHRLSAIQQGGRASEDLGHDGREEQMPGGQEDRCE
jgi:hypothetical protein